jgi:hypothetical protein
MWFNLVAHGSLSLIQRELGFKPELLLASNVAEARLHKDVPDEARTALGGSTKGMNALQTALVALADDDVVAFLISRMTPADLNAQWANGNTALHLAAVLGNADAVRLLMAGGADATVCVLEPCVPHRRGLTSRARPNPQIRNKFGMLPSDLVHDDPETADALTPMAPVAEAELATVAVPDPAVAAMAEQYPEVAHALASSPIFSRPSFGGDKVLEALRDPAGALSPSPATKRQRVVPVLNYTGSSSELASPTAAAGAPSALPAAVAGSPVAAAAAAALSPSAATGAIDPYSNRAAHTTGPVTVSTAVGSTGASGKVRTKDFRRSLLKLADAVQASGLTSDATRAFVNKVLVRGMMVHTHTHTHPPTHTRIHTHTHTHTCARVCLWGVCGLTLTVCARGDGGDAVVVDIKGLQIKGMRGPSPSLQRA